MKRDRIKTLLLAEALICALLALAVLSRATPFLSPDSPAAQWGRD